MKQTPTHHNNFINYLILLVAFFVLLFFTKNIYSDLQVELDTKEQKTLELQKKQKSLSELNELKNILEAEESEALQEIQWFLDPVTDTDILDYIYTYARDINLGNEKIIIRDLTISEWLKSDTWFLQANVTISALYSWEKTLFTFIDYLIDPASKYRFYLNSFNYPMNDTKGNIQVTLPLSIYYK